MREIHTEAELAALLVEGTALTGVRLQGLDLTAYETHLATHDSVRGLVIFGGILSTDFEHHLREQGAVIFPHDPGAPINPYRAHCYAPEELYAGLDQGYAATPDALAHAWLQDRSIARDAFVTMLRAIHDDSITDALDDLLHGRTCIGVMGGHALERGSDGYAAAAHLGHTIAEAGFVVLTGGGPGAMEAANLGAFAPTRDALDRALTELAAVPSFRPDIAQWARLALQVRADLLGQQSQRSSEPRSIGVPTWFYGHEPPGVFCDVIAKYFSNALREDTLLARAGAGLVVLEGAAGTVQEIFQAVTPRYYAAPGAPIAPLVLVGVDHWSRQVPVWPAIEALGRERAMADAVHLVDTVAEAAEIVCRPLL